MLAKEVLGESKPAATFTGALGCALGLSLYRLPAGSPRSWFKLVSISVSSRNSISFVH